MKAMAAASPVNWTMTLASSWAVLVLGPWFAFPVPFAPWQREQEKLEWGEAWRPAIFGKAVPLGRPAVKALALAIPWHDPQLLPGPALVWHPRQSGGEPAATGYRPTTLPLVWQTVATQPEKGAAPVAVEWTAPR